jgi:hypothetical protein
MRYVAYSRPTDDLVIFTKKPQGDKIILNNERKEITTNEVANKINIDTNKLNASERLALTNLKLKGLIKQDCK